MKGGRGIESVGSFLAGRSKTVAVAALLLAAWGAACLVKMPVADYPEVAPTLVSVSTTYSGASPQVVADTVATPIETEINAVDNVEYFDSRCNDTGAYSLFVTFKAGTDPDINLVNVQNAVKRAEPKLPGEVVQLGLTVKKAQSDYMLRLAFTSGEPGADLYLLGNIVCKEVKEALQRVDGVSQVSSSASGEYAMRVWLDSGKMDALGISVFDVRTAISQQNIQPAAGNVGNAFASDHLSYKINVRGRLVAPEEFENIVVRTDPSTGARVLLGDIARCELGVQNYESEPRVDGKPTFFLSIYRDPEANTGETAKRCREALAEWMPRLPPGSECTVVWDCTEFTAELLGGLARSSAIVLAVIMACLALVSGGVRWTLAAALSLAVSVLGTFAFMRMAGFSFNAFSGFGLLLAAGAAAQSVVAAARRGREAGGTVLASAALSAACYLPLLFHGGMVGMMYVQFAGTLCCAVALSAVASTAALPVFAAALERPTALLSIVDRAVDGVACAAASLLQKAYMLFVRPLAAHPALALLLLAAGLLPAWKVKTLPKAFVPREDRGFIKLECELSEGSSIVRSSHLVEEVRRRLEGTPGVAVFSSAAASSHVGRIGENRAEIGLRLKPWAERYAQGLTLAKISEEVERRLSDIHNAVFTIIYPAAINGLGGYGGVAVFLCALGAPDPVRLAADAEAYADKLRALPQVKSVATTFSANSPQLHLSVDRDKAQALGVAANAVFSTLQSKLASFYVNDFNVRGGAYQVVVQNAAASRGDVADALDIRIPGADGAMVPLSSIGRIEHVLGPRVIPRFNKLPSAGIVITPAEGVTSLDIVDMIERDPPDPSRYVLNWSTQTFQERSSRGRLGMVAALALAFMYLFLVAHYESWTLPFAVLLPSAVAVSFGIGGLWLFGEPLSIYAQLGLLLLVEWPARSAMLVVSFARRAHDGGMGAKEAAAAGAARAFGPCAAGGGMFAVALVALFLSRGVGAAAQRAFGATVLPGTLAALLLGMVIAPALYSLIQGLRDRLRRPDAPRGV